MPGCDTLHLEILAGVPGEFQNFGCEVLENGGGVNGCGGTDAMTLVHRVLEKTVDTTYGELESGLAGTGLRCLLGGRGLAALATFSSFTTFS
jgi:hypothetical protein